MPRLRLFSYVIISLVAVVLIDHRSAASGQKKEENIKSKSDHMQAMRALKERVPMELRIMERTPIYPDEQSLARGEELYNQQCAVCHGRQGRGDGPAASGLQTPPANFLDERHSNIYGPGEKFWLIANGSNETGMPSFSQLSPIDRWHLVNYIYHLQAEGSGSGGH